MDELSFDGVFAEGEDDALLARRDPATQIATLVRALRLRRGFGLYFVCVRQTEQRQQVLRELRERLPDSSVREVFLRERTDALLPRLRELFPELPVASDMGRPLLCVFGMENWLGGVEEVRESAFVADLNVTRNAFAGALGCPLIFIVPEHIWVGVSRGAPDFFSVRSGLYFLDTPPEQRFLPTAEMLNDANYVDADAIGIEVRQEAIEFWEELLNGYRALPEDKRDPISEERSLRTLAQLYESRGDYDVAYNLFKQDLPKREKIFGEEHIEVADALNALCVVCAKRGFFNEAISLGERALKIRKSEKRIDAYATAVILNNLGYCYKSQDKIQDALRLYEESLSFNEQLKDNNADTASILSNISIIYHELEDYDKALQYQVKAIAIRKRLLSEYHPDLAFSFSGLAVLYQSKGDVKRAILLYERSLKLIEDALGKDHPHLVPILNNLGLIHKRNGNYPEAYLLLYRALEIAEAKFGSEDTRTVAIRLSTAGSDAIFSRTQKAVVRSSANPWRGSLFDVRGNILNRTAKSGKRKR